MCVYIFFLPFQHDYHSNIHSFTHASEVLHSFYFFYLCFISDGVSIRNMPDDIPIQCVRERVCVCLAFSRKLKKGEILETNVSISYIDIFVGFVIP